MIFDLDGTLADTMPAHYKACQLVCNAAGFDFPLSFFYEKAGIPTHKVFKILIDKLQRSEDPQELSDAKEAAFMSCLDEVTPITPVANLIELHPDLPRSVGSGGLRSSVLGTLESIDLINKFEYIVSCDDVTHHKPHPETFLKCAELMNIDPKYCEVFEDSDLGLQAARNAGMIATDIRPFIVTPSQA